MDRHERNYGMGTGADAGGTEVSFVAAGGMSGQVRPSRRGRRELLGVFRCCTFELTPHGAASSIVFLG